VLECLDGQFDLAALSRPIFTPPAPRRTFGSLQVPDRRLADIAGNVVHLIRIHGLPPELSP